jgi:riboflavin kinase/FMN adenylyltransferase
MIQIRNPFDSQFAGSDLALTIGNFDGVHLGHQSLLQALKSIADQNHVLSAVLTFYPHPVHVLYPERKIEKMFDQRDLAEVLANLGINYLFEQSFDLDFAKLDPHFFLKELLQKKIRVKHLVVGHDFAFGNARSGDLKVLQQFCKEAGIGVTVLPPFEKQNQVVSSTLVRQKLKNGEVADAKLLLGRPFYFRGLVQKGFQRGRTLGVPTANLFPDVSFVPKLGVYMTQSLLFGRYYNGITNVGVNPTVSNEKHVRVETHLFDFNQDVYGKEIRVEFLNFLRNEKKFSNLEVLKEQIYQDILEAKRYFGES